MRPAVMIVDGSSRNGEWPVRRPAAADASPLMSATRVTSLSALFRPPLAPVKATMASNALFSMSPLP
jgi:hypothetical protein